MSEKENRNRNQNIGQINIINSNSDDINSSENAQITRSTSIIHDSHIRQGSQTLSFINRKIFQIIILIMLLIIIIILVSETMNIANINKRKKEEINNLNEIIDNYKKNEIDDNNSNTKNIIQSSIISTEIPKTTIKNYSNHTTRVITTSEINKENIIKTIDTSSILKTNIKIRTTNIIKTIDTISKISSTDVNTFYTTNIKNYFTVISGTTLLDKDKELESTTIKAKDSVNIDIGNNNSTIIKNLNCSSGYYISYDINGNKQCQKCHVENCNNCIDDGICILCESSFLPYYENGIITYCEYPCKDDPENKCLSCENDNKCKTCNIGYKLVDGMCLINHSIKAIYYSQEDNNNIQLINNTYEKYILEMIVDGNKIEPTYNYNFQEKGNHTVYFLLNNNFASLERMFNEINDIIIIIFTKIFNTENIKDMSEMFSKCDSLRYAYISNFNTKNVINIDSMFYNCKNLISINLSNFNTQNVIYMGNLFSFCENLAYIDISNFNTQNVKDMGSMFYHCLSLTSIDVSKFNTKNVNDMSFMFSDCKSLSSINLANFDTQNVNDVSYMFYGCTSLTSINILNFDTKNVTNMKYMFSNCKNLKSINLLNFDTHKVNKLNSLFSDCNSLTSINLSKFNTQNVNDMKQMFENCLSLNSLNLSNFDTRGVTDMRSMFCNCKNLTILDISSFRNYIINDKISLQQLFKGIPYSTNIIMNNDFSEHKFVKYQLKNLNITIIE